MANEKGKWVEEITAGHSYSARKRGQHATLPFITFLFSVLFLLLLNKPCLFDTSRRGKVKPPTIFHCARYDFCLFKTGKGFRISGRVFEF